MNYQHTLCTLLHYSPGKVTVLSLKVTWFLSLVECQMPFRFISQPNLEAEIRKDPENETISYIPFPSPCTPYRTLALVH